MQAPKHHILICSSSRLSGEPKGGCFRRNSPDLVQYTETELADRGMEGILVTNTGCLKQCDDGPVLVLYPEGRWVSSVNESAIDSLLDELEEAS